MAILTIEQMKTLPKEEQELIIHNEMAKIPRNTIQTRETILAELDAELAELRQRTQSK